LDLCDHAAQAWARCFNAWDTAGSFSSRSRKAGIWFALDNPQKNKDGCPHPAGHWAMAPRGLPSILADSRPHRQAQPSRTGSPMSPRSRCPPIRGQSPPQDRTTPRWCPAKTLASRPAPEGGEVFSSRAPRRMPPAVHSVRLAAPGGKPWRYRSGRPSNSHDHHQAIRKGGSARVVDSASRETASAGAQPLPCG